MLDNGLPFGGDRLVQVFDDLDASGPMLHGSLHRAFDADDQKIRIAVMELLNEGIAAWEFEVN
jgi:hypothetical protein